MKGPDFFDALYHAWAWGYFQGRKDAIEAMEKKIKEVPAALSEATLYEKFRRTSFGKELNHVKEEI